ncbi:hypothetical protein EVB91_191 [Rhizobium phage RHph_I1_18]|nr:hypothetical protein EVB91_191 [Rhizobium phage RHph_I1_18]
MTSLKGKWVRCVDRSGTSFSKDGQYFVEDEHEPHTVYHQVQLRGRFGWHSGCIFKQLKDQRPKQFWLAYDYQIGRWRVETEPFKVIRPGMEIFHVDVISSEVVPE